MADRPGEIPRVEGTEKDAEALPPPPQVIQIKGDENPLDEDLGAIDEEDRIVVEIEAEEPSEAENSPENDGNTGGVHMVPLIPGDDILPKAVDELVDGNEEAELEEGVEINIEGAVDVK